MLKKNWVLPLFTISLVAITFFVFRSVMSYLLISAVFALIAKPIFVQLQRIKFKRFHINKGLAALISILTIYGLLTSLIMIFIPSLVEELRVISEINPQQVVKAVQEPIMKLEVLANKYMEQPMSLQDYLAQKATSVINVGAISDILNMLTAFTGSLFISFFAITFITFFFLKDTEVLLEKIYAVIPTKFRNDTDDILFQVNTKLTRYFVGICVEVLLVFALNSIGLWIVGVQNFLIIALFAGIINVIPYVGPLIGIIFGLAISLSTNYMLDWDTELFPLLGYTLIVMVTTQLLDNFIFQPLIYSNSVNAHPLEIFLVILITGNFYGIIGMMIAVPLYSIVRVIVKEIRENSKILAEIYGDEQTT